MNSFSCPALVYPGDGDAKRRKLALDYVLPRNFYTPVATWAADAGLPQTTPFGTERDTGENWRRQGVEGGEKPRHCVFTE